MPQHWQPIQRMEEMRLVPNKPSNSNRHCNNSSNICRLNSNSKLSNHVYYTWNICRKKLLMWPKVTRVGWISRTTASSKTLSAIHSISSTSRPSALWKNIGKWPIRTLIESSRSSWLLAWLVYLRDSLDKFCVNLQLEIRMRSFSLKEPLRKTVFQPISSRNSKFSRLKRFGPRSQNQLVKAPQQPPQNLSNKPKLKRSQSLL